MSVPLWKFEVLFGWNRIVVWLGYNLVKVNVLLGLVIIVFLVSNGLVVVMVMLVSSL